MYYQTLFGRKSMIHLEARHRAIIQTILAKYPYIFYAFGSRVQGTHKPFSDLDLCVLEDIPITIKCQLEGEFEESNLPFKVDIIEWNKISEDFKALIKNQLTKLN